MTQCDKCLSSTSCERPWKGMEGYLNCVSFDPVMTNADRIRNMTDEELAEFLEMDRDCYRCILKCIGHDGKPLSRAACMLKVREWLKEEEKRGCDD